jgi:hypothetical protein
MFDVSVLLLVSWLAAPAQATDAQARITCEFRVFDGGDEISRETRVVVYPSGRRENGVRIDARGRARLDAGLYDVQAIRERNGQVAGIRWLEHLLIVRYPDEEDFHLEIINFNTRYGALELKQVDRTEYDAAAFAPGDHARPVATALPGAGYLLLVVPAGRYDVRVRAKSAKAVETWLPGIDVPAGRTRLRTLRPPDGGPPGDRVGSR